VARPARICLIGPVLPFRGGISHYNSMLFQALEKSGAHASIFSFSRQYPKWLYPGADDRDPGFAGYLEPGADYSIDSVNPISWWRTVRAIARTKPDLVVFHWWTVFWAPCFWFMANCLKRQGIRIGIICHNLADHDAGRAKGRISQTMLKIADAYLVHSSEHAKILRASHPETPLAQHPIPVYDNYPQAVRHLAKRGRLELLFFGFIRRYKGLDVLLGAMRKLNDSEVYLTVIGEYWGNPGELLEQVAGSSNIDLHLGYMSDEEAANHFARADFVVLPYRKATGSAVASVAFHYDKPIIASRTGGLVDVVIEGETGKLVSPDDVDALANVLRTTERREAAALSHGVGEFKANHGWASLCTVLIGLADPHQRAPE
jgi:glycosyltransferase involved in cell wall biosynthesis